MIKAGGIKIEITGDAEKIVNTYNVVINETNKFASATHDASKMVAQAAEENKKFRVSLSDMHSGLKTILAAFGGVTAFFALSIRDSRKAAQSILQLQSAVQTAGASWDKYGDILAEQVTYLKTITKWSGTDIRDALSRLVNITGSVEGSMRAMNATMGFAQLSGFRLATAARQITQVMSGNVQILGQWIPKFKNVEALQRQFKDQTELTAYALRELEKIELPEPEPWERMTKASQGLRVAVGRVLDEVAVPFFNFATKALNLIAALAETGFGKAVIQIAFFTTSALAAASAGALLSTKIKAAVGVFVDLGKAAADSVKAVITSARSVTRWSSASIGASVATSIFAAALSALLGLEIGNWLNQFEGFRTATQRLQAAGAGALNLHNSLKAAFGDKQAQEQFLAYWQIAAGIDPVTGEKFTADAVANISPIEAAMNAYEQALNSSMDSMSDAWDKGMMSAEEWMDLLRSMQNRFNKNTDAMSSYMQATRAYAEAVEQQRDLQESGLYTMDQMADSIRNVTVAQKALQEEQEKLNHFIATGRTEFTPYEQLIRDVAAAHDHYRDIVTAEVLDLNLLAEARQRVATATEALRKEQVALSGVGQFIDLDAQLKQLEEMEENFQKIGVGEQAPSFENMSETGKQVGALFATGFGDEWAENAQRIGQAWDATMMDITDVTVAGIRIMGQAIDQFANAFADALFEGKVDAEKIFKGIAKSFIKLFVKVALNSLLSTFVPGFLAALQPIGPHPTEDRMVMDTGRKYVELLSKGMNQEMQNLDVASKFPGVTEAGTNPELATTVQSKVVVHEATPRTWVDIYDEYLEPRAKQREDMVTEAT